MTKLTVSGRLNCVAVWVDGRWVVDASTFNESKLIVIDFSRLKFVKAKGKMRTYKFVGDGLDKKVKG